MVIRYLSPGTPEGISGGTRKLYDHAAILADNGIDAEIVSHSNHIAWQRGDIAIVPEVYGDGIKFLVPAGISRVGFCQNGYLVDRWGCHDPQTHHPYADGECPDLLGVMTESEHTDKILRARFPDLRLFRTHSSGNGRFGKPGPFRYGEWPRERKVMFFRYKHDHYLDPLFSNLLLPDGWSFDCLTGRSDEEIAESLRTGAIFVAPNFEEGMCAPTSEAMISGALIVAWPGGGDEANGQIIGGGTDEYLPGRALIAPQGDTLALRVEIQNAAMRIEHEPDDVAADTRSWSDWFQATYSRQGEIDEVCELMAKLQAEVAA